MTRGTIRQLLETSSTDRPDGPAVLDGAGAVTTYADLLRNVDAIAATVVGAGVPSDRAVAVVLANGPVMASAFLGVASAAVCAPLNPSYTEPELSFFYDDLDVAALVTDGSSAAAVALAEQRGIPVLSQPFVETDAPVPTRSPEDVALVLHTSGTTARPKQVPLAHANLCTSAANVAQTLRLTPDDRCFNVMPLFHIHGLVAALLATLHAGGSVVCTPGFDATRFLADAAGRDATWYTAVPTMHQAVLAAARRDVDGAARCRFRFIRSSSAALPPLVMRDLEQRFDVPVIEAYGMTEASHQMASNPIPPGIRKPGTVGVAAGSDIAIMAPDGELLPAGAIGEIVIRGPAVTSGYIADNVNAEAFAHGWFHTGDQGVLDVEGYLTITGRLKEIINRGGEKVSPREVEEALLAHPSVAQAVAFAIPHTTMGEDVAAAIVPAEGSHVDVDDVRTFVGVRLAAHKVPQRVVVRDELPLGPTGKLQRIGMADRLGLTSGSPSATDEEHEAAISPMEEAVALVWAELLHLDHVGRRERFVELGGDSLTAVALVAQLEETFDVDLPLTSPLGEGATVATMAALITEAQSAGRPRLHELAPDAARIAVSFSQERFSVLQRLDPSSSAYNVPLALRLHGPLDVPALTAALTEIVRRHEALRSSFPALETDPSIVVQPPSASRLEIVDLSASADPAAAALGAAASEARRPFDLAQGPVMRSTLYRLDDGHLLVLVIHHIATDGWSRGILRDELSALYAAFAGGQPSPLPDVEFGYPVWAAAQRHQLESGALAAGLDYWRQRLAPLPPPVLLATDRSRGPYRDPNGATVSSSVDSTIRSALGEVARAYDATLFMTLLSGFIAVLRQYTRLDDIVVGIPVAGRLDPRTENVIGPFLNTLPIRVAVDGGMSFGELLGRVRVACLEAYEHQHVPFERMVEEANVPRTLAHAPIVQVLFQLRNLPASERTMGTVTTEDVEVHTASSKFDLSVDIDDRDDQLVARFEYPTALFDAATIERFGLHFERLLRGAARDPNERLDHFDLLDEGERVTLSALSVEGGTPDAGWTVPERVAEIAASRPSSIAVRSSEGDLSYADLLARADELAQRIGGEGEAADTFVGVCLPRTLDLPAAVLAAWRAGAAVVPLDPSLPPARLAAIITEANVDSVLTVEALLSVLPPSTRTVRVDVRPEPTPPMSSSRPRVIDPTSIAYAMSTSGSTGTPKCVLIEHGSLARFLGGFATRLDLDNRLRMLASTPVSFDPFVRELLLPLVLGGEVVLCAEPIATDAAAVIALIRDHEPSVVQGTPTTLQLLLDAGWRPGPSVTVLSCGEPMNATTAQRLMATSERVWNLYGPTETTQCAVVHELAGSYDRVPVGRPLPGVIVEVVGDDLEPVPRGVPGEILIGGSGLGPGYGGATDPVPEGFVTLDRGRRYRTGDFGRWGQGGLLECLGRNDDQLKLNGVRIEPGDAEAALTTHPSVRAAAIAVRDGRLVAFVTLNEPIDDAQLRLHVAALLPAAMVPNAFVVVAELPLLPSGKVDRAALSVPPSAPARGSGGLVGDTERRLARLWAFVLDIDGRVGRDDDFFSLGGHSILAIDLTLRIERIFGRQLQFTQFFETPTLAGMAAAIDAAPPVTDDPSGGPLGAALVPVRKGDPTRPLLLWIPGTGGTTLILHRLAAALPDGVELMGFEAAPHRGLPEPPTLAAMAAAYADDVRGLVRAGIVGSHRPYVLAGSSFGAGVAHEVAVELFQDECPPGRVLLVDPLLAPIRLSRGPATGRLESVRRWLRRRRGKPNRKVASENPLQHVMRMSSRLRREHTFRTYPGSVVLVTTTERRERTNDELIGMRGLVEGAIDVHPLPGLHHTLLVDDRVPDIAKIASDVIDALEAESLQVKTDGNGKSNAASKSRK